MSSMQFSMWERQNMHVLSYLGLRALYDWNNSKHPQILRFIKVSPTIALSSRSPLSHTCKIPVRFLRFLSLRQPFPLPRTRTTNPMMMIHARINIMAPKDCNKSTYNSNKPKILNNSITGQKKLRKQSMDRLDNISKHHVYIGDYRDLWESGPL